MDISNLNLELTPEHDHALQIMEQSNEHLFLTGKAGTGKSTLLDFWKARTSKRVAVLAPTGLAAINVGGMTIHRFFGWNPFTTEDQVSRSTILHQDQAALIQSLDTIVMDEVSMVRADILDMINTYLMIHGPYPGELFGGVQIIFMGDLYQLPPVDKGFDYDRYETANFFSADCIEFEDLHFVELDKVFRQTDEEFIHLLNSIRDGSCQVRDLIKLSKECMREPIEGAIQLTPMNRQADLINDEKLAEIDAPEETFYASYDDYWDDMRRTPPADRELVLKPGARVMLVRNDLSMDRLYVNGDFGTYLGGDQNILRVRLDRADLIVGVPKYEWEEIKYISEDGELKEIKKNRFVQFPIKRAYAVTIHKSQGQTYDKVHIINGRMFTTGQMYVALSRCRTTQGMTMDKPITKKNIKVDDMVRRFYQGMEAQEASRMLTQGAQAQTQGELREGVK